MDSKTKNLSTERHFQISSHSIGGRRNAVNQDRLDKRTKGKFPMYAVYDGHGGPEAAAFCQKNLLENLQQDLDVKKNVPAAMQSTFLKMHNDMLAEHANWPPNGIMPSTSGTTASVLVFVGKDFAVGNVGDSPVLRIRRIPDKGTLDTIELGKLHKPGRGDDEHIRKHGGIIDGSRVIIPYAVVSQDGEIVGRRSIQLSMTRALGNFYSLDPLLGEYAIQPIPTVTAYKLDFSQDCFLVLATDGITDVLKRGEIAEILQTAYGGVEAYAGGKIPNAITTNVARLLCEKAQARWVLEYQDDCTAIVFALVN